MTTLCPRCAELVRENEKMREALEFYADRDEHHSYLKFDTASGSRFLSDEYHAKARSALAPAQPEAKPCQSGKMIDALWWECRCGKEGTWTDSGNVHSMQVERCAGCNTSRPPEAGKCPHGGELSPVSGMCAGDCSAGKTSGGFCADCGAEELHNPGCRHALPAEREECGGKRLVDNQYCEAPDCPGCVVPCPKCNPKPCEECRGTGKSFDELDLSMAPCRKGCQPPDKEAK